MARIENIVSFLNDYTPSELYHYSQSKSRDLYYERGKSLIKDAIDLINEYDDSLKKYSRTKRKEWAKDFGKTVIALSLLNLVMVKNELSKEADTLHITLELVQVYYNQIVDDVHKRNSSVALAISVFLGLLSILISLLPRNTYQNSSREKETAGNDQAETVSSTDSSSFFQRHQGLWSSQNPESDSSSLTYPLFSPSRDILSLPKQ